jgi:PIN domain nuclease of toxin-antitoxin system
VSLLLDTQLYLWFLADSSKLTKRARTMIDTADEVWVSAASIWEAAIKSGLGRLEVDIDSVVAGIGASGFKELPIRAEHAAAVVRLPDHHRDPFDRLLVAQALNEPMRLLTTDKMLKRYSDLVVVIERERRS